MSGKRSGLHALPLFLLLLAIAGCTPAAQPITPTAGPTLPATEVATQPSTPTAGREDSENLAETQWMLESFGPSGAEMPVVEGSTVTLEFDAAGRAGGSSGCNTYGGQYTIQDNTLSFSEIASTLIACADESVMQQEQQYLQALQSAGRFELTPDRLAIFYDDGRGVLNFARAAPGQPILIAAIQMLDPANGWAVGGQQADQLDRILLTADGGQTWQDRTPPDAPPAAEAFQTSPAAFFESTKVGWVSYPRVSLQAEPADLQVVFTGDGGQSWTSSQPLDFSGIPMDFFLPSDLGFIDSQLGWLLAHLGAGMSHDYVAIYTTGNGGQSWQRVVDPEKNPEIQGCVKSGLLFTSPTDGWLAGDCPGLMPPLFLYHTTDGGMTWSQTTLPAAEGQAVELAATLGDRCGIPQIEPVTGNSLFLTLRCIDPDQGVSQAWLYLTTDAGQSWQSHPLPLASARFEFINPDEGWLLGSDQDPSAAQQEIYHTADGGQTWRRLAAVAQSGNMKFVDSQNGWIAAGVDLLRTADGGRTWQEIQPMSSPAN